MHFSGKCENNFFVWHVRFALTNRKCLDSFCCKNVALLGLVLRQSLSKITRLVFLVLILAHERLVRDSVQPGEDAMLGLALEVEDAADGAVVLAVGPVQVDAGDLALGKLDVADEGDATALVAVDPDGLADHEAVGVLVEDFVSVRLAPEAGLAETAAFGFGGVVDIVGHSACIFGTSPGGQAQALSAISAVAAVAVDQVGLPSVGEPGAVWADGNAL